MKGYFLIFALGLVSGSALALREDTSDFKEDIAALERKVEKLEEQVNTRQETANVFNPALTVFGNVLGCISNIETTHTADDGSVHDHATVPGLCATSFLRWKALRPVT